MRVRSIDPRPFHRVRYLNAGRKGRVVSSVLEVLHAVDTLPDEVDAIIVASDLQGWCRQAGELTTCGHVHWAEPLAETSFGQVLNVDARAVVLRT